MAGRLPRDGAMQQTKRDDDIEALRSAIDALEAHRQTLGDALVKLAIALLSRFHKPEPALPTGKQDKRTVVPLEVEDFPHG